MDPIKNTGAVDYAMTVPQNQEQVQNYEDYSSMPMVYDPEMEQKKKSSSNMLGMVALGAIAAGGIYYGARKGMKVSGLKQDIARITAEKDVALKAKDDALKAKEETVKALDKERTLSFKDRIIRLFNPEYKLTKEEVEARNAAKKAKAEADKAAKEAEKAEKKAAKGEKADKTEKTED